MYGPLEIVNELKQNKQWQPSLVFLNFWREIDCHHQKDVISQQFRHLRHWSRKATFEFTKKGEIWAMKLRNWTTVGPKIKLFQNLTKAYCTVHCLRRGLCTSPRHRCFWSWDLLWARVCPQLYPQLEREIPYQSTLTFTLICLQPVGERVLDFNLTHLSPQD